MSDQETPSVPKTRVCSDCKRRRPNDAFYKNIKKGKGYRPECKPCTMARRQPKLESPA